MLNDEQILLKTAKLLENFDISEQKPDKLLRELDEIELEALDNILDDMKGEDLAFNGLFNGEMRKVIDFPTMDNSTELGKFGEFFKKQDLEVDWEKGLVSAERSLGPSTEDLVNQLMGGPDAPRATKKKKIQMKVGKFFAKVADLSSKRDILYQKVYDHLDKMNYTGAHGKIDVPWKVSGKMIRAALDEKELEDYNRINTQIGLYIPNPGMAGTAGEALTNLVARMAKYWQTNAGYIKKEINKLDNDKYSIIITRHPIDVLRMSDFEKITSCHSPPSRSGGTNEYYKCAVAEAQGHGALAYVVETEDLLRETNTSNIESAEQEIQEGEIFYDDERTFDSGLLEPISRARLRQMRYYDTDTPKRWDDGTELAVPEERIYGVGIPGLSDRVREWARKNQEEALKNMPSTGDDGEDVNLDRFFIFGGSYEDTSGAQGRESLLSKLAMIETEAMTGNIRQNKETEDALDANAISGLFGRYTAEVEQIEAEWNQRYAAAGVSANVEDDGEGGVYIEAQARITFKYDLDEFSSLPNSYPTGMHAFDSINDIWGDIFDTDSGFVNKFSNTTVHIGCRFNLEHPDIGESALMYSPDVFDAFCAEIDKLDDRRDAFKAAIDEFLKREGYLEGGEYIKLAYEIEDAPFESYEWDVRSDGEDPSESYTSTAAVSHDFNPEALGVSPQVLTQILDSRDWRLFIREELLKHPRSELGVEYYLDIGNSSAMASGEDIEYTIEFKITADDPDARVQLFRELTTGEMDDEDRLRNLFNWAIKQMLNQRLPAGMQQNLDERLVKTWKGFLGRI